MLRFDKSPKVAPSSPLALKKMFEGPRVLSFQARVTLLFDAAITGVIEIPVLSLRFTLVRNEEPLFVLRINEISSEKLLPSSQVTKTLLFEAANLFFPHKEIYDSVKHLNALVTLTLPSQYDQDKSNIHTRGRL